jgi:two-component system OmpR family response regulator
MPRVLVVEDERKVLRGLERGLRSAGYDVVGAANGTEGMRLAATEPFDCILLDWMLPGHDGIELIATLRQSGKSTPVLLLTAKDAVEDRVLGLDCGADDYMVKPFSFAELLARLRALLRRGQSDRETILRAGDVEIDLLGRRVTRQGSEVEVTSREFEVLEYLVRHRGHPVTRDMLGRDVWKEPNIGLTNIVDVYINQLRKKLDIPGRPSPIATIRGVGYRVG